MDTRQIEYILQIAEENNITKAAEKLFITQSALNQQLLKLERELGTPLFQRTKNKWCLTDAGRNAPPQHRTIRSRTSTRAPKRSIIAQTALSPWVEAGFSPAISISCPTVPAAIKNAAWDQSLSTVKSTGLYC